MKLTYTLFILALVASTFIAKTFIVLLPIALLMTYTRLINKPLEQELLYKVEESDVSSFETVFGNQDTYIAYKTSKKYIVYEIVIGLGYISIIVYNIYNLIK